MASKKSRGKTKFRPFPLGSFMQESISSSNRSGNEWNLTQDTQVKQRLEGTTFNTTAVKTPTKTDLETAAQECIEHLADTKRFVSPDEIQKALLRRFNVTEVHCLGLRDIGELQCVHSHIRLIAKVIAYIRAFVKVRSICTLHELEDSLKEFSPDKKHFKQFNIGPLQQIQEVFHFFKLPKDLTIPEITTIDILEHLDKYLTKEKKWSDRVDLGDFLEYLVQKYDAEDPCKLGIRITSIALAIEVLKKAKRNCGMNIRSAREGFNDRLCQDLENAFQRFRASVINRSSDGTWEVRNHYLKLRPELAIQEIFQKFNLILSLEEPNSAEDVLKLQELQFSIRNFLQNISHNGMAAGLFHLAICISSLKLQESAMELLPPRQRKPDPGNRRGGVRPSKESLVTSLVKYLEGYLQHGTLTLSSLDEIEKMLTNQANVDFFGEIGCGRFLQFALKEATEILEEYGGVAVGFGSERSETENEHKPSYTDILGFIHQCLQSGIQQEEDIEAALCYQFSVTGAKQFGYGKTAKLVATVNNIEGFQSFDRTVTFEVAIGSDVRINQHSTTGMLGHQTVESALICLYNCPLMEDMSVWSHWSILFEPEFGQLKTFIQKYSGTNVLGSGEGKVLTYAISALEISPGVLLKLTNEPSVEQFVEAPTQNDPWKVCGHLMSLIVASTGMKNAPLLLLSIHIKSHLYAMHANSTNNISQEGPFKSNIDDTVKFVLKCLVILPVKSCVLLANQIFLKPLAQVVGSSISKSLLLSACATIAERNRLEVLGCMLGVGEWTNEIDKKMKSCNLNLAQQIINKETDEVFGDIVIADDSSTQSVLDCDFKTSVKEKDANEKEGFNEKKDLPTDHFNGVKLERNEIDQKGIQQKAMGKHVKNGNDENTSLILKVTNDKENNKELLPTSKQRDIIENIRKDEFGVGLELNVEAQKLKNIQDERLGRCVDRLSKDLYSKDTHFVLELIQNADDNDYPEFSAENATVKFVMLPDRVIVLNNECGFQEKDIRAICDVGRSTKGKHKAGYIGQKGIGFKSVFRVTDQPEVHSNGYHICFDTSSGPIGYILPHWINSSKEVESEESGRWTTKIILTLKEQIRRQVVLLAARFNDIQPSLLLFLHRLREIVIDNKVDKFCRKMTRTDVGKNLVEIEHDDRTDRWLVVKKILDATKLPLQVKSGVDVESTEIALAFPLLDQLSHRESKPPKQPVFAFLPLRSYGFRFIIQGDFEVPSSREDVDKDSVWNQWIINEIHKLFFEALDVFKSHDGFTEIQALVAFLRFIPIEDEILGYFRSVATQILQQLRAKPCLPIEIDGQGSIPLKLPNQVVAPNDHLVKEVLSSQFLEEHLGLFYLHKEVANELNPALLRTIGINTLTTCHFLQMGKVIESTVSRNAAVNDADIILISKWLACVYRSLDEFQNNHEVYNTLMKMKIFPLSSRKYVSLQDTTVFFPFHDAQLGDYGDALNILLDDMNVLHHLLLNVNDSAITTHVQKLLSKLSVCDLSPTKIVNHHIIPVFESGRWKRKERILLINYLVYIKEQFELDPNVVDMDALGRVAVIVTNQGVKNATTENVNFTPEYGNHLHLTQIFPGFDWCLIDDAYISNSCEMKDTILWRKFLSMLGVTDFIKVKHVKRELDAEDIRKSHWYATGKIPPENLTNGCIIEDFISDEMEDLVKANKDQDTYALQMKSLCECLDQFWVKDFAKYAMATLVLTDTNKKIEVESSLSMLLKNAEWMPAIEFQSYVNTAGIMCFSENVTCMTPSSLYCQTDDALKLLAHTVNYADVQFSEDASPFARFLGLKCGTSTDELIQNLKRWGKRSDEATPTIFLTSSQHISNIYLHLAQNLPTKQVKELLDKEPIIFVPISMKYSDMLDLPSKQRFSIDIVGKMLSRQEVRWEDKTELFSKHQDLLNEVLAEIGNKTILSSYKMYSDSQEIKHFFRTGGVQMKPDIEEYAKLLVQITSVESRVEQETLKDVIKIYSMIGEHMRLHGKNISDSNTIDEKSKKILKHFKGQCIIPTHRRSWTTLESNPMFPDSSEYKQILEECEKAHFLIIDDDNKQRRSRADKTDRVSYKVNMDAVMDFLKTCGIRNVTEVTKASPIPILLKPCPRLQLYMTQCMPLVQRLLYNRSSHLYKKLVNGREIVTSILRLQCFKTSELRVRYECTHDPDIFVIKQVNCFLQDGQFLVQQDVLDTFTEINKTIAQFVAYDDDNCMAYLGTFLHDIHNCLMGKSYESIDDCLSKYNAESIPESEEKWNVPAPIISEPEASTTTSEKPEETTVVIESKEDTENVKETSLKSWPPNSNDIGRCLSGGSKLNENDQKRLQKWLPPKPPEELDIPIKDPNIRETVNKENRKGEIDAHITTKTGPEQTETDYEECSVTIDERRTNYRSLPNDDQDNESDPHSDGKSVDVERYGHSGKENRKCKEHLPQNSNFEYDHEHTTHQTGTNQHSSNMGMYTWNVELLEYEFEELATGDHLKIPTEIVSGKYDLDEISEIGRIGEKIVFHFLNKKKENNSGISSVVWCNEDKELGQPYDFEVCMIEKGKPVTIYIEVKSTKLDSKEIFEISYPQIKFAQKKKGKYHVYRIFNVMSANTIRLVRIQNLAEKINKKQIKLSLLI